MKKTRNGSRAWGTRLSGYGQGLAGGVAGTLALAVLIPALSRPKMLASSTTCAANLTGIMKSMILYSADNNDAYPYLGSAAIKAQPPTGDTPGD